MVWTKLWGKPHRLRRSSDPQWQYIPALISQGATKIHQFRFLPTSESHWGYSLSSFLLVKSYSSAVFRVKPKISRSDHRICGLVCMLFLSFIAIKWGWNSNAFRWWYNMRFHPGWNRLPHLEARGFKGALLVLASIACPIDSPGFFCPI